MAPLIKNLPSMQETWVWSLGQECPLEKGLAAQSSVPSCLENPHGQRRLVGHSLTPLFSSYLGFPGGSRRKEPTCQCRRCKRHGFSPWVGRTPGGGHGNPLQYSHLENLMDRGAWCATVQRVTKSWTRLKWPRMHVVTGAFLAAQTVKNQPAIQETWVWSVAWEDSLEKGTATYSSVLPWKIPWTPKPGGLQSMGSQRVVHNWATNTFTLFMWLQYTDSIYSSVLRKNIKILKIKM